MYIVQFQRFPYMAVADVYLPEMAGEDHLTAFPRAPPPSPEMQPRNHSRVFDIPASKFEEMGSLGGMGMGLDLRRNTFPLDEEVEEEEETPFSAHHLMDPMAPFSAHHLSPMIGGCGSKRSDSTAVHFRDYEDEEEGERLLPTGSGSPHKRVCCSPGTLPSNMMTTAFPSSSNHNSLVSSSGFGSFQPLGNSVGGQGGVASDTTTGFLNCAGTGSHSGSISPSYFSSIRSLQTSPHLIAQTQESSAHTPHHTLHPPPHHRHTPSSPAAAVCLSRSYDLHTIHPHLPHSFETTQLLPQTRPSRSRTLDSTSQDAHARMLDAHYGREDEREGGEGEGEDPTQRRRKVSIKRKNPDEDDSDPNLQFSFEYSYSSTGSTGESDWVMVDHRKMEPAGWPLGKKACCASDPIRSRRGFVVGGVALQGVSLPSFSTSPRGVAGGGGGGGLFEYPPQSHNPQDLSGVTGDGTTGMFPPPQFANSAPPQQQPEVGVAIDRVDTPTNQIHSMESETMMDCEGRLDSLDGMDCTTSDPHYPMATPGPSIFGGVVGGVVPPTDNHMTSHYQQPAVVAMESDGLVMRTHPRDATLPAPSLGLRRSCVEEYLQPLRGQGVGGECGSDGLDADLDKRLNLSKSL